MEIARDFHARGWMLGTAGNLSVRVDPEHFWITASGKPKGRLEAGDFLLVRVADGEVAEAAQTGNRPSAETAIHRVLYARFPDAGACLHGHSIEAVLAAERAGKGEKALRLPPVEMLKGFNLWQQNPRADLALFENHLDVAKVARDVAARFRKRPPALTAMMIRGHGATVWGPGLQVAYNRYECLEFILGVLARRRGR